MGGNYEDLWTLETFKRRFDEANNRVVITDTISGFDRFNSYNFNTSIGTTLYGRVNFKEGSKIQVIRHVVRPTISYGFTPSFNQFYDELLDSNGELIFDRNNELRRYTRFEGTLNGVPSLNRSNAMSFDLANTIEAKVRSKDSTATEPKKIQLLRNLNFNTAYNFDADSLKLSPLNFTGGTSILNNKMAINFGGTLDPYAINNSGARINVLNAKNGGSLFRLTNARANISYALSSKDFEKKDDEDKDKEDQNKYDYSSASGGRTDDLFGDADFMQNGRPGFGEEEDEEERENTFYSNKIPWDLRLAYTVSYANPNRQNAINNHSLMFSGDIELTPNWKVGASSGYDFVNSGFTITQLRFQRELGSFNLRFNWTPFGRYERWDFFIGISSSILQDLKWDKQSRRR
jgi:hypothetical protein